MNPIVAWIFFMVGGAIYHAAKSAMGFNPSWGDYAASAYWLGIAFLTVQCGWVRP